MENLNKLISEYKLPLALSFVGLVLIIGGVFSSNLTHQIPKQFPKESLVSSSNLVQVKVDVSGAVAKPGVYSLTSTARIQEAIIAAGGFSDSANQIYISKNLNLSQKISDGQKIYVPSETEQGATFTTSTTTASAGSMTGKIGINSATESELDSLPGIGPVTAQKVITMRPYGSIDELYSKKAVSKSVFDKIKDSVDLN